MTLEEKIDKIAEDSSYMRGCFDTIIPELKETVKIHTGAINDLKSKQDNMSGKASVIGAIMGAVGGFLLSLLTKIKF